MYAIAKIAISLNLLYYGLKPSKELHETTDYTLQNWEENIKPELREELLMPTVRDDCMVYAVTEIRGDWKFLKVGFWLYNLPQSIHSSIKALEPLAPTPKPLKS